MHITRFDDVANFFTSSALIELKTMRNRDRLDELARRPHKQLRFQDAAQMYLDRLAKTGGKNLVQKQQQLRDHLIPFFRGTLITKITTEQVDQYKHKRLAFGAARGTVNTELAILKHLYSQLKEWSICRSQPFTCKLLKTDNARVETFSKSESELLLNAAKGDIDPYTYLFILIGLNTGMRHREIISLRFEYIDFVKSRIYLPCAKTGSRVQPFPKLLAKPLLKQQAMLECTEGWVFPSRSKTGHRGYMKSQFKRVVKAIEMDPSRFTPHVMRHTAITTLLENGVPIPVVQKISGHRTLQMLLRYTHISDPVVDEALGSSFVS